MNGEISYSSFIRLALTEMEQPNSGPPGESPATAKEISNDDRDNVDR